MRRGPALLLANRQPAFPYPIIVPNHLQSARHTHVADLLGGERATCVSFPSYRPKPTSICNGVGRAGWTGQEDCPTLSDTLATCVGMPSDRKSTRLNSSHLVISYAVFCLKKKKKQYQECTHYQKQNHSTASSA